MIDMIVHTDPHHILSLFLLVSADTEEFFSLRRFLMLVWFTPFLLLMMKTICSKLLSRF